MNETQAAAAPSQVETRKVGLGLGIGIALLPMVFSWFTLRKGHTALAKGVAFTWLVIALFIYAGNSKSKPAEPSAGAAAVTAPGAPPGVNVIVDTKEVAVLRAAVQEGPAQVAAGKGRIALVRELNELIPAAGASPVVADAKELIAKLQTDTRLAITVMGLDQATKWPTEHVKSKEWLAAKESYEECIADSKLLTDAGERADIKGLDKAALAKAADVSTKCAAGLAAIQPQVAKAEAGLAALKERCGPQPVLGVWDREFPGGEALLRKNAHDPGSIDVEECTKPALTEKACWVSTCKMRGKNTFGALVLSEVVFSQDATQLIVVEKP